MGVKYTEAQAKASKKYLEQFEEFKIRVPKGEKSKYIEMAKAEGKSLNQFVIDKISK